MADISLCLIRPQRIYKTLITHVSQRVSVKQLMHFVQLYRSGSFQMYDYKQRNRARYNQTTAPLYNLKAITAPVSIYAATEDWLIAPVVS
jgi:lysosomal acid lipase/cholesteryl ester hydrolase